MSAVQVPVTNRTGIIAYALIDIADLAKVWGPAWNLKPEGYVYRTESGTKRKIYLHRQILGLEGLDYNTETDHINHNRLDNRRQNLRVVSRSENQKNSRRLRYGVSARNGRWVAWASDTAGKQRTCGSFPSRDEALLAAQERRRFYVPVETAGK